MARASRLLGTDCTHTIYVHASAVNRECKIYCGGGSDPATLAQGAIVLKPATISATCSGTPNVPVTVTARETASTTRTGTPAISSSAWPFADHPGDRGPETSTGIDREHDHTISKVAPGDHAGAWRFARLRWNDIVPEVPQAVSERRHPLPPGSSSRGHATHGASSGVAARKSIANVRVSRARFTGSSTMTPSSRF